MSAAPEKPIAGVISGLIERLSQDPERLRRSALIDCWPQVVGEFFSKRTTPKFTNNQKVIVWSKDSVTAFELRQRYKATILKRLQNQFGETSVQDVLFMVGEGK